MEHQHQIQKYTCPMHPHILQDAPGKCPLCGMTLEPVVQTAPGSESDEITKHSTHGGMVSDFQKRF